MKGKQKKKGKVVKLPAAIKLVEYRKSALWCEQHFSTRYKGLVSSFMNGIKDLQRDAWEKNKIKATIHNVVEFTHVNHIDELKEQTKDVVEYTAEEWNHLWKAAAYEISKGTQVKKAEDLFKANRPLTYDEAEQALLLGKKVRNVHYADGEFVFFNKVKQLETEDGYVHGNFQGDWWTGEQKRLNGDWYIVE